MPGNSQRRGAMRKPTTRKGPQVGTGGQRRKGLEGRGPTPKADERTKHPAAKNAAADGQAGRRSRCRPPERTRGRPPAARPEKARGSSEIVAGRNSVVEALRAEVPVDHDVRRRPASTPTTGSARR